MKERILMAAAATDYASNKKVILAISIHETGNYKSNVFKRCNNAFGLKTFSKTKCKSPISEDLPGKPLYYMDFSHPEASVYAFANWCKRRNVPEGLSDLDFLKAIIAKGYSTDKEYYNKVSRLWKSIK